MSGTHYTLDRDRKNPMQLNLKKTCTRCRVSKDNTYAFFGKKLWRSRTEYTTTDVCSDCVRTARDATYKKRKEDELAFRRLREAERAEQMVAVLKAKREADENCP